jgi:vacuolar-type H+-ATPase subunit E/Vma4
MRASDLDSELRRGAERTVASVRAEALQEADRLASKADRAIAARRKEVIENKEAEYLAEGRVAIAAARHAAMRAVLLARTRLVERVLGGARALLTEAAQSQSYLSTLGEDTAAALQFIDAGGAVVRCSPSLESNMRELLRDRTNLNIEADAELGTGFVVIGDGGSVRVDGRLESRLDRLSSALAIEIHSRLEKT